MGIQTLQVGGSSDITRKKSLGKKKRPEKCTKMAEILTGEEKS